MKRTKLACKEVMEHICENLGEELESPKCVLIKSHLDSCNNCQNYFKSVEDTINFYKNYNVELPEKAHKRLIEILGINK